MTSRMQSFLLVMGAMAFCAVTARAEELASVEKQIIQRWQKHRSMRAKLTQSETTEAKGNKATQEGEGVFEFMRKGDQVLCRLETKSSMKLAVGDQNLTFDFATLRVCDGTFTYELSERMGTKTARKTRPDPLSAADVKTLLATLHGANTLKLLDEQTVGNQRVFAIEATPQSNAPGRPYKTMVYYFSQEHGVLIRQEARDPKGKVVQSTEYSQLEFDGKIDPKRFEFKAPEGVIVRDLSGG